MSGDADRGGGLVTLTTSINLSGIFSAARSALFTGFTAAVFFSSGFGGIFFSFSLFFSFSFALSFSLSFSFAFSFSLSLTFSLLLSFAGEGATSIFGFLV